MLHIRFGRCYQASAGTLSSSPIGSESVHYLPFYNNFIRPLARGQSLIIPFNSHNPRFILHRLVKSLVILPSGVADILTMYVNGCYCPQSCNTKSGCFGFAAAFPLGGEPAAFKLGEADLFSSCGNEPFGSWPASCKGLLVVAAFPSTPFCAVLTLSSVSRCPWRKPLALPLTPENIPSTSACVISMPGPNKPCPAYWPMVVGAAVIPLMFEGTSWLLLCCCNGGVGRVLPTPSHDMVTPFSYVGTLLVDVELLSKPADVDATGWFLVRCSSPAAASSFEYGSELWGRSSLLVGKPHDGVLDWADGSVNSGTRGHCEFWGGSPSTTHPGPNFVPGGNTRLIPFAAISHPIGPSFAANRAKLLAYACCCWSPICFSYEKNSV